MSAYQTLTFHITGVSPLLMHNGQLSDPLNPHSQHLAAVTKKRGKTVADYQEMARREFFGGLYVDENGPCLPGEMIEAAIVKGAMKEKRGPQAKAGILVENNARLEYEGPRDPKALWEDDRFRLRAGVRVKMDRVMRTRPRFDGWSATIYVKFLPTMVDPDEVRAFLVTAGEQIGIGDWRPRFGRFTVA